MKDRLIARQFEDPTFDQALKSLPERVPGPSGLERIPKKKEIHLVETELARLRVLRKRKEITSIDYELQQAGLAHRIQDLREELGRNPARPMGQFTKHGIPRAEIAPISIRP